MKLYIYIYQDHTVITFSFLTFAINLLWLVTVNNSQCITQIYTWTHMISLSIIQISLFYSYFNHSFLSFFLSLTWSLQHWSLYAGKLFGEVHDECETFDTCWSLPAIEEINTECTKRNKKIFQYSRGRQKWVNKSCFPLILWKFAMQLTK